MDVIAATINQYFGINIRFRIILTSTQMILINKTVFCFLKATKLTEIKWEKNAKAIAHIRSDKEISQPNSNFHQDTKSADDTSSMIDLSTKNTQAARGKAVIAMN